MSDPTANLPAQAPRPSSLHDSPATPEALEARLREATGLLAVARVVGSVTDLGEGLRLICHELGRLTGAETVSAQLLDGHTGELRPIAAHVVPRHAVEALTATTLTRSELAGLRDVFVDGRILWSDDVPANALFSAAPFRGVPHQSALFLPLVLDGDVAGAFYLVWWQHRRRFEAAELAFLSAIGEQAGALLSHARLRDALQGRATRLWAPSPARRPRSPGRRSSPSGPPTRARDGSSCAPCPTSGRAPTCPSPPSSSGAGAWAGSPLMV